MGEQVGAKGVEKQCEQRHGRTPTAAAKHIQEPAKCDGQQQDGQARPEYDGIRIVAQVVDEVPSRLPLPIGISGPGRLVIRELKVHKLQRNAGQVLDEWRVLWVEPVVAIVY